MKQNTANMEAQTSSGEVVASIDDLLTIILSLVPIQSLLRFKSVSKSWCSLISSPRFCCLRNPNPNPAVGIFLPPPSDARSNWYDYIPLPAKEPRKHQPLVKPRFRLDGHPSGIKILQSCNGFMLCCGNSATDLRNSVHNPTTGEFSILPKTDEMNGIPSTICGMNLAFDPVKSPYYNVVYVWFLNDHNIDLDNLSPRFQIEMYSSETGTWRICGEPFSSLASFDKGVYWNGAIHWICTIGDRESLYFNIGEQKLRKMPPLPLTYSLYCKRDYYFGESGGHLHLIDLRGPQVKFNVFELKPDYSGWFVKFQVDISGVVAANPCMALIRNSNPMHWCGFLFSIFAVVRGGKDEDSFLVLQIPGKAVRFNIVGKYFKDMWTFEERNYRYWSLKYLKIGGFQYIPSICRV